MGTLLGEDENEAGAEQEVFIKTVTGGQWEQAEHLCGNSCH